MHTLFWHDYETWGATPGVDKPSQFAGIRTDEELNTISDPLVCYCQPAKDCLPHPQACLITGITPQQALSKGKTEAEFFALIHRELAQPGTCGVGYNSIRFDDEVTRHGLYRNFYDPYEREWKNGNSRWDIIDMVRLVYALKPDTLQWPKHEAHGATHDNEQGDGNSDKNGAPSFKLEHLAPANGIIHENAHDALADVRATIALAQRIKTRQPRLYQYVYGLRDKKRVAQLIDIQQRKPLLHISSRFPASRGCAALVAPLMAHPSNRNSVICYDLSVDPQPLLTLSADEIYERVYTATSALPAGVSRIPLKEIHLNKSPIVATTKLLDDPTAERLNIDKQQCNHHWQQLNRVDLTQKLTDVYNRQPFPPALDAEQQLYDGFINDHDRQLFTSIRNADPHHLAAFTEQLQDQRLHTLLFRYRARNYPQTLTEAEQDRWREWCFWRLSDPQAGAGIVLEDYFNELEQLAQVAGVDQTLIHQLQEYGDTLLC